MHSPLSPMALCDTNKPSNATDTNGHDASNAAASVEKPSIVELKNGKVVFKQKPISFEKHSQTLQEIVQFREMLEERMDRKADSLLCISEEHKPVIAKLVHESDKTLGALAKHILQELLPVQEEDSDQSLPPPLTLPVVESSIKSVATRINYGLDGLPGVKPPAAVCVWRWEANARLDWLPKNAREKAENRIAERVKAKSDLKALFDLLPKDEQDSIVDPKGTAKASSNATDPNTIDLTGDDTQTPGSSKKKKENEGNDSTSAPKVGRPKKILDSEKAAKEKEKQEKKAAKAEKEQKEKDAQNKSRSLMQNFFKAPAAARISPAKEPVAATCEASQFQRTFKSFVVKKDTTVAPVNWFMNSKNKNPCVPLKYEGDFIIVEDNANPPDVAEMSAKERLFHTLQNLPPPIGPRRTKRALSASRLKTSNSVSVREMIKDMNEAEVSDDIPEVRRILGRLSDRDVVPAKILIFADDARPGYFGTWTRNSRIIGPRTPFAKDVAALDYGYDSGEEWEDEPSGDADDLMDDGEEEDVDPDDADADSDTDSWLVDDDDDCEGPVSSTNPGSPVLSASHTATKRKVETEDIKLAKKRKVVVPLVPFAKGPSWEQHIGRCADEFSMFNSYRIQFFNDASFPIDPFSFVSQEVPGRTTQDGFVVPPLPNRLVAAASPLPTDPSSSAQPVVKKPPVAPKTTFPDDHLLHLLNKITTAQTASLPILVDTIYQDLRQHKVKKNAIEAKVREVAEKCKFKKVWVLKEQDVSAAQVAN